MKTLAGIVLALFATIALADPTDITIRRNGVETKHHANTRHAKNAGGQPFDDTGELRKLHMDYPDGHSEWHVELHKNGRRVADLNVPDVPIKQNARVHVKGKRGRQADEVDPESIDVLAEPQQGGALAAPTANATLVLLDSYADQNNYDASWIPSTQQFFAGVSTFFLNASYGKQSLAVTVATVKMTSTSAVSCAGNGWSTLGNDAETVAASQGYNMANYRFVVHILPAGGCGWAGLGYVGYGRAYIAGNGNEWSVCHEMGHNFGLYHAGSISGPGGGVTEYGDPRSMMGNVQRSCPTEGGPNALQLSILQWFPDSAVKMIAAGASAQLTLTPIEIPNGATYMGRIATPDTTVSYTVSQRATYGNDTFGNILEFHCVSPCGTSPYTNDNTQYVGGLTAPGGYTLPGTSIPITLVSISSTGAVVQVGSGTSVLPSPSGLKLTAQ